MIFKNTRNQSTYYEVYGDLQNPALFLIHGLGADNEMWNPQKEKYAKAGFRVIVPDMLAHGKSAKVNGLELGDWDNQIIELMSHLGINKASFVGVSMGGVIVQHFAVNNPACVEKLVISDSFCELSSVFEKFMGYAQALSFKYLKKETLAKFLSSAYKDKEVQSYFQRLILSGDLSQTFLARKAINKVQLLDKLKEYKGESLVLVGADAGASFVKINQKIADVLNTNLIIIPNAMDPSSMVNPTEFNKHFLNFLK